MSHDPATSAGHAGTFAVGGRAVARIGLGAMQLERLTGRPADARALLRQAVDLGVDHIDTAQFYADGFVNDAIRRLLAEGRQVVVATKVGADPAPGAKPPIKPAQRPEQLRASVEANLRSLGMEQLPLVNLRRLDIPPGLTAEGDQVVDIEDQLAAMIAMRDQGKVGAIGISAASRNNLERALPAGINCVQSAYSLLSRRYGDMLDLCASHGIAWIPFFPLGGAHVPGWPRVADHPRVVEIAADMAVTPPQLGLAWLLAHRPNIALIPGTSDAAHLRENIGAGSLSLGREVMAELDALGTEMIDLDEGKAG